MIASPRIYSLIIKYYGSYYNISKFTLKRTLKCIDHIIESEKDNELWELYVSVYPNFDEKSFMNFSKFKRVVTGNFEPTMTEKDKARIDANVDRINKKFANRTGRKNKS